MSKEDVQLFFQLIHRLQSFQFNVKEKALVTTILILVPGTLYLFLIMPIKSKNFQNDYNGFYLCGVKQWP